jgi:GDPmannose 4,6-dehydratase
MRGETFVTRKITRGVAAIELGFQKHLYIGNLDARRDWGFAGDFVKGMWLMLQQPEPDDFVLATGKSHSVREFAESAFSVVGRHIGWKGSGDEEVGIDAATGEELVRVDKRYFRPTEIDDLLGDPSKAHRKLGWRSEMSFAELVTAMVKSDLKAVAAEAERKDRGAY